MTKTSQKPTNKTLIIVIVIAFVTLLLAVVCVGVFVVLNTRNIPYDIIGGLSQTNEIDGLDRVTISKGDVVTLTVAYKPSTGYVPYAPIYDADIFELVDTKETHTSGYGTGSDNSTRTYYFKAINTSASTLIETGTYRSWEEDSKMVQDRVSLTVN